jgi:hypothetical protein
VDRIADFLRRYPKASVDLAARMPHLELQRARSRESAAFFVEFQDRILYGSDLGGAAASRTRNSRTRRMRWLADWQFLAGSDELHSTEFDAPFRGLALPRDVLARYYAGNASGCSRKLGAPAAMP